MSNGKVHLKVGRDKSLFYKHPWIFSGAIQKIENKSEDSTEGLVGAIVDVVSSEHKFLAKGYYNPTSSISVRILSFDRDEEIDLDFFVKKISALWQNRQQFLPSDTNACRVVFAESDGLPGLIVDKYNDVLVVQIHTLGMDKLRDLVVEALVKVFNPKLIYERSDVSVRKQDGLNTMPCGVLYGDMKGIGSGVVQILEHGLKFGVDIVNGQKTGFFMDQRENRLRVKDYVAGLKAAALKIKGKVKVLNLFSYTGGFSVYALDGGADQVTSVDVSKEAIFALDENVELNKFDVAKSVTAAEDVFAFLDRCTAKAGQDEDQKFDMVIVDPPAFVKTKKDVDSALKAYSRLNAAALGVLKKDGLLVSSSCSGYVKQEDFKQALFQAALKSKSELQIIESRTQPFDHPINIFFPEGEYLKFFVCRKG